MKDINYFQNIVVELSKYSNNFKLEFINIFPCPEGNYFIPIRQTIALKGRQVGPSTIMTASMAIVGYVDFSSEADFWQRWNRFKKLKAFL